MQKRKFELLVGIHDENNQEWDAENKEWRPVLSEQGRPTFTRYMVTRTSGPVIVESPHNLVKLFANKFREIKEPPVVAPPKANKEVAKV